jgi:GNAT superfamily N-acetyltransferase
MNYIMSAVEIEIRLATAADAGEISRLLRTAFAEYESLYTDRGFSATTLDSEWVLRRLREGPGWLAILHGEPIGTVSSVLNNDAAYLRGMAVLPSARGLRCGELMLRHVEAWALEHNCLRLILSTTPFLDRAIRLYESYGFRRTDAGPHDIFGTPLFTMEKSLAVAIDARIAPT